MSDQEQAADSENKEFKTRETVKTEAITNDKAVIYWKRNLKYLTILLSIWFIVSFGCSVLFVDYLDQCIDGFKLGFWFGQQGSILVFVVLIWVYVYLMNKLDKEFGFDEGEDD
ncbi:MAG: DUF4212 domain-containing protein [Planctomycetes bacterium]|nr:DUF4212 domain-containing protein [Planctomycetota bacterium]